MTDLYADITVNGSEATTYLYYGDHWNANFLGSSTYAFYPIVYNGTGLTLHKTGAWTLNAAAGTWTDLPYTMMTAADSTTANGTLVRCNDSCQGGVAANMTSTQTFTFTWSGSAGDKVLGIEYTYEGPKNAFKHVAATIDGVASSGSALMETSRSDTIAQEAPLPVSLSNGSTVLLSLLDFDGVQLLIDGVKIYDFVSARANTGYSS